MRSILWPREALDRASVTLRNTRITAEEPIPTPLVIVLAFAFGACIGSFLNVVLWRIPRNESIVHPPSHCPSCGHELDPAELVPIVSWIALRARCRECGVHISVRYPLVELGVAVVFALIAWAVFG
jgi:leader peptidase (prepilin peptidase)/N-methyltransferase